MKKERVGTSSTLVMKFGGTSVGSPEALSHAAEIVQDSKADWKRIIVVTSALSGVTDMLLESATLASRGEVHFYKEASEKLRRMHYSIVDSLISDQTLQVDTRSEIDILVTAFSNLCQAIAVLGEATPRALDAVAAMGERMSVRLLAAVLESRGIAAQFVEAKNMIITDDHYQAAHPDMALTKERVHEVLEPILAQGLVPVVTGFVAGTKDGVTTTLGRGGSDYSAAIIGTSLPANEVWIWTDVDGVMTADPRLMPEARTVPVLTYREVAELAYFGARVLHPKTIRPVIEEGISLRVGNTFNPKHPGTQLVAERGPHSDDVIKAITIIPGLQLITLEGRGMLGVTGVAARTFAAVASTGTSVPLITQASSEQSICFAVGVKTTGEVLKALEETFAKEIDRRDIDRVWATEEVAIATVVGEGMRSTRGVAGRVFTALGTHGVNVIAIAQGSSEVSISLVVDAADVQPTVKALHGLIVRD